MFLEKSFWSNPETAVRIRQRGLPSLSLSIDSDLAVLSVQDYSQDRPI